MSAWEATRGERTTYEEGTRQQAKESDAAARRKTSDAPRGGRLGDAVGGPDELPSEYDPQLIRDGVRGKYAERYAAGATVVVLDLDVAAAFPDAAAVYAALRALLEMARREVGGEAPSG